MAWQAQMVSLVTTVNDADNMHMTVNYYDDVNPTTILYTKLFNFLTGATKTDIQNAVIAEGQRARALATRVATIKATVPDNTIIAIP